VGAQRETAFGTEITRIKSCASRTSEFEWFALDDKKIAGKNKMRKKERQTKLVVQTRVIDEHHARVRHMADQLHEVYKRYKAGIITEKDLSPEQKRLLVKYFGL
jgi:hypothetical protein